MQREQSNLYYATRDAIRRADPDKTLNAKFVSVLAKAAIERGDLVLCDQRGRAYIIPQVGR